MVEEKSNKEDVEDESYELIGERKTGEFVWIDLEGSTSTSFELDKTFERSKWLKIVRF